MKKLRLLSTLVFAFSLCLASCSSEEEATNTTAKSVSAPVLAPEVEAFKQAYLQQVKEKSQLASVSDAQRAQSNEAVLAAAKKMLIANGTPVAELEGKSAENAAIIKAQALRILAEKTKINPNY